MKPYGVDRQDRGCCPGHDKYPADYYHRRTSRMAHRRARRCAHKRARARLREELSRCVSIEMSS
jgi:hypothetical protein